MLTDTDKLSLVEVQEMDQSNDFSFAELACEKWRCIRLRFRVMWKGHSSSGSAESDENVKLLKTTIDNRDG